MKKINNNVTFFLIAGLFLLAISKVGGTKLLQSKDEVVQADLIDSYNESVEVLHESNEKLDEIKEVLSAKKAVPDLKKSEEKKAYLEVNELAETLARKKIDFEGANAAKKEVIAIDLGFYTDRLKKELKKIEALN